MAQQPAQAGAGAGSGRDGKQLLDHPAILQVHLHANGVVNAAQVLDVRPIQLARAKAEEAAEAAAEVEAEVKNVKARKEEEDAGKPADKPRASEEGDRP